NARPAPPAANAKVIASFSRSGSTRKHGVGSIRSGSVWRSSCAGSIPVAPAPPPGGSARSFTDDTDLGLVDELAVLGILDRDLRLVRHLDHDLLRHVDPGLSTLVSAAGLEGDGILGLVGEVDRDFV